MRRTVLQKKHGNRHSLPAAKLRGNAKQLQKLALLLQRHRQPKKSFDRLLSVCVSSVSFSSADLYLTFNTFSR
jgi:hypothetical protein